MARTTERVGLDLRMGPEVFAGRPVVLTIEQILASRVHDNAHLALWADEGSSRSEATTTTVVPVRGKRGPRILSLPRRGKSKIRSMSWSQVYDEALAA